MFEEYATESVQEAIAQAERLLPGVEAPEGEISPRWQVIIEVCEYIPSDPEAVWAFVLKWGVSEDADLRAAISTCLLEDLLAAHFDTLIDRVEAAARSDARFARMAALCWAMDQAAEPGRRERFDRLIAMCHRRCK